MPVFIAAIFGVRNMRIVSSSEETWTTDEAARGHLVKRAIIPHYRQWRGHLPGLGKTTGYTLVRDTLGRLDAGIPYDIEGNPVGLMIEVERLGVAALTIKGHTIPPLLFRRRPRPETDVHRCGGCIGPD